MRVLILLLVAISFQCIGILAVSAADSTFNAAKDSQAANAPVEKIVTIVSEKVPGATCVCYINNSPGAVDCPA
jgi:hypothetical protein